MCFSWDLSYIKIYRAYHHYRCEFESRSGEVYSIQHYVIKFFSDLWKVGSFRRVLRFPTQRKEDRHDIAEITSNIYHTHAF